MYKLFWLVIHSQFTLFKEENIIVCKIRWKFLPLVKLFLGLALLDGRKQDSKLESGVVGGWVIYTRFKSCCHHYIFVHQRRE